VFNFILPLLNQKGLQNMIERDFDIAFIADLALREKQIQQNYRPIIAVHKWFARRPGTLFRGLLLSEFESRPLRDAYYQPNDFHGIRVADPFMGGGIPLIEANRVGCDIVGYDINPMAYWIVRREIEHIDLDSYREAAEHLRNALEKEIGHLYRTRCLECGNPEAHVKYFLWVKTKTCSRCGEEIALFPGSLVAQNTRHPKNVFVCFKCGNLTEADDREHPGECLTCGKPLTHSGLAKRNLFRCPRCGHMNSYPAPDSGPPPHRMFAIEYYCPVCRSHHQGRFFKKPDAHDLSLFQEAGARLRKTKSRFIPHDLIPPGDESSRLHRWGYKRYKEMFNSRQLLGLELSCRIIDKILDSRIRDALATNLSDLLRYQNMLCRYDKMALKSLDIFSVHGFPVGLIECESNLLGISGGKQGISIGSGGWLNIIDKFTKAKAYCDRPFEVLHQGKGKRIIAINGEWIGDTNGSPHRKTQRNIDLSCSDAIMKELEPASLDGVFTDPPYFGNVQYAELMDFCYAWLRKLASKSDAALEAVSTRHVNELTANENMQRGSKNFTEGLSAVFSQMAKALKPGAPLVFTYHHNLLSAYYPIAVAVLDAGLTCSASLPCPAEMGASIHIKETSSSIVDTIFVCRSTGRLPRRWLPENAYDLALVVEEDLDKLRQGNVKIAYGDMRCIIYGHLTRLAIWALRKQWGKDMLTEIKLGKVARWIDDFGALPAVEKHLKLGSQYVPRSRNMMVHEPEPVYKRAETQIPF
jgi:putative DNA methylase